MCFCEMLQIEAHMRTYVRICARTCARTCVFACCFTKYLNPHVNLRLETHLNNIKTQLGTLSTIRLCGKRIVERFQYLVKTQLGTLSKIEKPGECYGSKEKLRTIGPHTPHTVVRPHSTDMLVGQQVPRHQISWCGTNPKVYKIIQNTTVNSK